jgi:hypothetical protein
MTFRLALRWRATILAHAGSGTVQRAAKLAVRRPHEARRGGMDVRCG